jgi:hypothetical protein
MKPRGGHTPSPTTKSPWNAGWDDELLKVELESLRDDGIDLRNLGFSEDEFNKLVDELEPTPIDEESLPEAPVVAVSQPGDM